MALNEQIKTPATLLAAGTEIPFTIVQPQSQANKYYGIWDWYSTGLRVPVIRNENFLPFRVTDKTQFQIPEHINVIVAKKREQPIIIMSLSNFGSLPHIYRHGVLNIIANGRFCGFTFSHRSTSIAVKQEATVSERDIEVNVNDYFIANFESEVGPRSHTGNFEIEMFWTFDFLQEKTDYFRDIQQAAETEYVDGFLELLADNGRAKRVAKCLLAASSPKFKAQFVQDPVSALEFTIDGDVVITEESLEALQKFITVFSLQLPLEKCWVAADLLMAGHYHMFFKMESVMQNIILAQPKEWFDLETSARLFTFATIVAETKNGPKDKQIWENLKWKALRTMKSASLADLNGSLTLKDANFNLMRAEIIKMLTSLA